MDQAFGVKSKNSLSNTRSQNFFYVFFSKTSIVLHYIFKSMIYFQLLCVSAVRFEIQVKVSFFLNYECLVALTLFVERIILSSFNCLCNFVNNQLGMVLCVYFYVIYFVSLIYVQLSLCQYHKILIVIAIQKASLSGIGQCDSSSRLFQLCGNLCGLL